MKLFEGSDASEFFQADDWTTTDELAARFMAARMASRCGPILGASQMRETSALVIVPPRLRTISAACCRKMLERAPFHCGSDGGKWSPMSPAPHVARSASVNA